MAWLEMEIFTLILIYFLHTSHLVFHLGKLTYINNFLGENPFMVEMKLWWNIFS